MHKGLLAILLSATLFLAGCSGGGETAGPTFTEAQRTCPDGTVLTEEQVEAVEAHDEEGFDPQTLCPVPPKVMLSDIPATVQVYSAAPFSWAVDAGSVVKGHSMITEIRYATASVPDAEASRETYDKQVIKKEHQSLPVTFKGNMTFTTVGKVFVRAYASVQGEGYDRRDVWGPEIALDVLPVAATGVVAPITHAAGLLAGELNGPEGALKLGDAVSFVNEDVVAYTLTMTSAPAGAPACELTAASGATSAGTCLLVVPGSYTFETDDAQPQSVSVSVGL